MAAVNGSGMVRTFPAGTAFADAFELLAANLTLMRQGSSDALDVVCVVGAQAGHGTSTTALNLAFITAASGRRTLLIDCNLRAPSLHIAVHSRQSPGMAEVLSKKVTFADVVSPTEIPSLYFVPAGNGTSSPHSLLQPPILASFVDQARGGYDFVLIDTPPVLRYPDALQIARFTAGAIIVVPAQHAPRRAEMDMRRRLERAHVNVLGIVMNRVNPREALRY